MAPDYWQSQTEQGLTRGAPGNETAASLEPAGRGKGGRVSVKRRCHPDGTGPIWTPQRWKILTPGLAPPSRKAAEPGPSPAGGLVRLMKPLQLSDPFKVPCFYAELCLGGPTRVSPVDSGGQVRQLGQDDKTGRPTREW